MIKSPFTKLLNFLLAFSLLTSSLATAMISPSVNVSHSQQKQSQSMFSQKWKGSFFNVGGDATFKVKDDFSLQGSNLQVAKKLTLDAKKINVLAGVEETRSSSNSEEHQAGASIGFSAPTNVNGNASTQNSDSSSHSTHHVLAGISAGTMESTSKAFTVKGGKVNVFGKADVTTDKLTVASVQDTSSNHNQSKGFNLSGGTNGLGSVGGNASKGNGERKWTTEQSSFLVNTSGQAKDSGQIKAKHTHLEGGILASAKTDEYGRIVKDNGDLNLQTGKLTQTHLYDTDTQDQKGLNLSVSTARAGEDNPNTKEDESYATGSSTLGANHSGHNREQTTFASLGGGNIQIGGKKQSDADLKKQGLNTDITQTQKITKDQQTGGLNASVTVDHRLASEQGRLSIAKDFVDTALHADEIGRAVTDAVENESLLSLPGNIHDYATERNVLAQKAADKDAQDKLKGEQDAEGSQAGLQDLSDALSDAQGLDKKANVSLYDGSQVKDDTQIQDGTDVNKKQVLGAYHKKGKGIYINTDRTDMSNSQETVATLVHEQTRHRQAQEDNQQSREQQTYTAQRHGDRAGNVWGIYSKLNGHSNQGSRNHQQWQQHNHQNQVIQQGNRNISQINNNELKARQFREDEAKLLDQARAAINQQNISDEEKQEKLANLNALACAEVKCASGVPEDDKKYQYLLSLQKQGEQLKEQKNTDVLKTMNELGVKTTATKEQKITNNGFIPKTTTKTTEEQQFEYSSTDKVRDRLDRNNVNNTVEGIAQMGSAMIDTKLGFSSKEEGIKNMNEGFRKVTAPSENGQRVLNSFSASTHQGKHDPVEDMVEKATAAVVGYVALKKADKLLPRSILEKKKKPFSGNNGTSKTEGEFDGKNPSDYLAEQKQLEQQKIHQQNLVEIYTPPKQKPTGAYTLDNKYKDIQFYENLERMKKQTAPLEEKGSRGAFHKGASKILDGLKNILEEMDE